MIRTIRPLDRPDPGLERVAKANDFSLHAGVSCEGHQKGKRERLCRYIARRAPCRNDLATRLKRVFSIDIEVCDRCRGSAKVIACIEDQVVMPDKAGPSIEFWLIWRERNRTPPLCHTWNHRSGHYLVHCLFSLGRARGSRFQPNGTQSARNLVKTTWHESLRAFVQKWTDVDGRLTIANINFRPISR